jgi:hypothetical protein
MSYPRIYVLLLKRYRNQYITFQEMMKLREAIEARERREGKGEELGY